MPKPNVLVEGVCKKFSISLKDALKYGFVDSARRFVGGGKDRRLRKGEFWALHDVSFALMPGEALGIMGVNGSGKTTLLRILNGTYSPDRGRVTMRGRIGALIAAGAGFSPMLTGRENVFVSAALLGMTPKETRRHFDEIVAFSELEDFIDMPVRNYSSGMSVRLGFAVAVLGIPEVLLVDEVLAVGDISFQKKCYERIHELKREGTTILLVSHSPGAIWAVCDHGLVLNRGITEGIISVEQACREYENFNNSVRAQHSRDKSGNQLPAYYGNRESDTGEVIIKTLEILNNGSMQQVKELDYGQSFVIRAHLNVFKAISRVIVRFSIDSEIYKCISIIDNYEASNDLFELEPGNYIVDVSVNDPNLRPGAYSITAAVVCKDAGIHCFLEHNMTSMAVRHPNNKFLYADFRAVMHLNAKYTIQEKHDA